MLLQKKDMIQLSEAVLKRISVHYVGNNGTGGELIISKKQLQLSNEDKIVIKNSFLGKFSAELDLYSFSHPSSLDFNEVYKYCLETLAETSTFHKNSANMARHLHASTMHPKIKAGELYVCHYENCLVNGAFVEAIGIYKTETKSDFLDLALDEQGAELTLRQGVDVAKFDKAALVLPTNAEKGFDVLIFDSTNRGEEAVFWKEAFLGVTPQSNEYYQTNQFLTVAKQFIAKQLPEEYDIEKTDQIDLLNKSVEYFKANESFDKKKFEKGSV